MAHIHANRSRIIARIRRIQGQLEGVIRAVESGDDCFSILQTAAACRGALNGLVTDLLADHIQTHFEEAKSLRKVRDESSDLTRILRSYLR